MTHDWTSRGREVLDIEMEGLHQVRANLGPDFSRAVELLLGCSGRVAVTGIGKSGLVGRKIAATLSSTGTPAFFLHPVEGAHGDLGLVREGDVVIAISYSGKTDELNALLPALRALGARIIAITGNTASALAALAEITLDASVPREACALNLAPTSSTTATLALGDALAVCVMEGKEFTPSDFKRFHPGGALGQRLSLKVADLMHRDNLPAVPENTPLEEALERLESGRLGAVCLLDAAGRLTGILTDGDVRRMVVRGMPAMKAPAVTVMSRKPLHARADQSAAELIDLMEEKAVTVLPVLANDAALVGMVHLHDLLGKGRIKFSE